MKACHFYLYWSVHTFTSFSFQNYCNIIHILLLDLHVIFASRVILLIHEFPFVCYLSCFPNPSWFYLPDIPWGVQVTNLRITVLQPTALYTFRAWLDRCSMHFRQGDQFPLRLFLADNTLHFRRRLQSNFPSCLSYVLTLNYSRFVLSCRICSHFHHCWLKRMVYFLYYYY